VEDDYTATIAAQDGSTGTVTLEGCDSSLTASSLEVGGGDGGVGTLVINEGRDRSQPMSM
jgi:T5SS/PEP-CTERM-associated repeat protein